MRFVWAASLSIYLRELYSKQVTRDTRRISLLCRSHNSGCVGSVLRRPETLRRQGFFGAAMLPMSELEYTGIVDKLKILDKAFTVRRSL